MSGAKKHITAFALLLLVALPLLVSVGYLLQKQYVRHQMKEQLEKANLQTLLLQPDQLHWAEAGKELWINHQLFDVKEIQITHKGYRIKGLFDTQETSINQKVAQQGEAMPDGYEASLAWLLLPLYHPSENSIFIPLPATPLPQQYIPYQIDITTICLGVTTPPPDRA